MTLIELTEKKKELEKEIFNKLRSFEMECDGLYIRALILNRQLGVNSKNPSRLTGLTIEMMTHD